ncbi:MAG: ammonium transporter [Acidobacteriia bacterium]|nr:ammonium transporter [Terriglobia bacterium]
MTTPTLADLSTVACLFFIFLTPLAAAGLALINAGLGRSHSAAHILMASLTTLSVAALVYFAFGFGWEGFTGGPFHAFTLSGKQWNWIAAEPFFFRKLAADGSPAYLSALLQVFCVGLAAMIPLGSGADRWRLRASCLSTAILAAWTYPLFAHWVWGGGWLAQLGANYGLGRGFLDVGGAGTIQVLGGLTALSITWILGPRRGKYSADGMAPAIPGHNAVLVLFGCMLALLGWLGLNCAGTILFAGGEPAGSALIAMNTILAGAAAALTAAFITNVRFGKPDASLTANGWVAGLVASSAACAFVVPAEAVVIGSVAGAVVTFCIEWLELKLEVDDPGGAVSVHAIGGLWGLLAAGLFARFPSMDAASHSVSNSAGAPGQWLAQVIGVATLVGFVLPLTYGLNWLLNRIYPYRVSIEGERQGLDLHELGAGAYPEFITHTEDFLPR